MTGAEHEALARVKAEWLGQDNVTGVGWGFRKRNGQRTDERAIVVLVGEKLSLGDVKMRGLALMPRVAHGVPVDVQQTGVIRPHELTGRVRPVRPGVSIGSVRITAGTFGFAAYRHGEVVLVSNNHVFAASNDGVIGDDIIQPGKADGGFSGSDRVAQLAAYVAINFEGDLPLPPSPSECETPAGRRRLLALISALRAGYSELLMDAPEWAALLHEAESVLMRRVMMNRAARRQPLAIAQPDPNVVDCAVAKPVGAGVDPHTLILNSAWETLATFQLGDPVEKVGRTTEHTVGTVVLENADIRVDYGTGIARFTRQMGVEAEDGGDFSRPGDSGSGVRFRGAPALGGLLFAGGGGQTFINPIQDVFGLLELDAQHAPVYV